MHTKLWWVNLLKNGHMEDLTSGREDDITMNLGGVQCENRIWMEML